MTKNEGGQRQDSLYDQMQTLHGLAIRARCYDAADFIRARFPPMYEDMLTEVNKDA